MKFIGYLWSWFVGMKEAPDWNIPNAAPDLSSPVILEHLVTTDSTLWDPSLGILESSIFSPPPVPLQRIPSQCALKRLSGHGDDHAKPDVHRRTSTDTIPS